MTTKDSDCGCSMENYMEFGVYTCPHGIPVGKLKTAVDRAAKINKPLEWTTEAAKRAGADVEPDYCEHEFDAEGHCKSCHRFADDIHKVPSATNTATDWESKFRDAYVLLKARDEEVQRLRAALTEIANGNLWGIPQTEWQTIAREALKLTGGRDEAASLYAHSLGFTDLRRDELSFKAGWDACQKAWIESLEAQGWKFTPNTLKATTGGEK